MRNSLRSTLVAVVAIALPSLAHAHPGHDGHELTWDFSHLAAHPLATLGCFLTIGASAWIIWRFVQPSSQQTKTSRLK